MNNYDFSYTEKRVNDDGDTVITITKFTLYCKKTFWNINKIITVAFENEEDKFVGDDRYICKN